MASQVLGIQPLIGYPKFDTVHNIERSVSVRLTIAFFAERWQVPWNLLSKLSATCLLLQVAKKFSPSFFLVPIILSPLLTIGSYDWMTWSRDRLSQPGALFPRLRIFWVLYCMTRVTRRLSVGCKACPQKVFKDCLTAHCA